MPSKEDRERVQLLFQSFRNVNIAFHRMLVKAATPHGVTPVQVLVMRVLSERPRIGLAELAQRIQIGNSTASGIVDRMEKAGLVVRERGTEDRRSIVLSLTERGVDVWRKTDSRRMELLEPLLALPTEDIEHLVRINERITEIFNTYGEDTPQDE
ncbi:MarR family transcriptional regulator [Paenibacillus antri]|uniref:MarR family transcriptional regulator n=1 Tax=Paenibacillus antri TaxID=2582848 RepID=A0A5R9GGY2_9BACL|nr:MarR family transcriptional regulator [Paenibacillus antri]TLS53696.1 MarR family transcriptional regulator [Paenibacillus antri]